ncbi:energy transducer TonB [Dysgonomonas sp. Marseille-P4361]|uniref:energy transducer TonB n=1 Tax=Dysgonomonas sp. Marseille-P4361 TaxID=2161820 RepID=UPI000D55CC57|nr:energy transducer TonB [Dysgonomonas sp. Marseille-P4361]
MKNLANLNSTEWCDIVFENKNKEYGAFALRQTSWKRHVLAFLLILTATLLVSFLPLIMESVSAKTAEIKVTIDGERKVTVMQKPEENIADLLPPTAPEPPKFVEMKKFVPPTIVDNDEVTDEDETMMTMEELTKDNTTIGAFNVEDGSTDENAVRKTIENLISGDGDSGKGKDGGTTPVSIAEIMPQFPGGEAEMYKFIKDNLKYPVVDQETGTQGRVTIRFVVSKTGEISNIEVLRGVSPSCDREALRVVKSMPNWIPGRQNGNTVPVYFTLPIVFKLK